MIITLSIVIGNLKLIWSRKMHIIKNTTQAITIIVTAETIIIATL